MNGPPKIVVFGIVAALVACGGRTNLNDDRGDSETAVDSSRPGRDSAIGDTGIGPRDTDVRPAGECRLGETFWIYEDRGAVRYPALARRGGDAMIVFTRIVDSAASVYVLPITPSGNPVAAAVRVGRGEGGTIVPYTLGWGEPGFTVAFRADGGFLGSARMDVRASDVSVSLDGAPNRSLRPLLVLGERLAVNGWETDTGPVGFLQDLTTRMSVELTLPGFGAVGALVDDPDRFVVAGHDGASGIVEERDREGRLHRTESLELTSETFPVGTQGVELIDHHPGAFVVYGGTIRALWDGIIAARLDTQSADWFLGDTLLHDLDAAYEGEDGWLGMAVGVLDRGHAVRVLALHQSGVTSELTVAESLDIDFEPHPAILDQGPGAISFLVVWAENREGFGTLRGAHVTCGV